jgi:hypothetical protein
MPRALSHFFCKFSLPQPGNVLMQRRFKINVYPPANAYGSAISPQTLNRVKSAISALKSYKSDAYRLPLNFFLIPGNYCIWFS